MSLHRTTNYGTRPALRAVRRRVAGILVLAAIASRVKAGEIYKSVDANGHIVFSDHLESPSSQATVVNLRDSTNPLQSADAPSAGTQGGTLAGTNAPPPLPPEEQPPVPQPDELWMPGYWTWQNQDYVWVPGTWAIAPRVGYLWTPPWWGLVGRQYFFHAGHWGPTVGFYGGINYGYGYFGNGYSGGRWAGNHFAYNSSVTRVGAGIGNQYAEPAANAGPRSTASFRVGPSSVTTASTAVSRQAPPHASAATTTVAAAAQHPPGDTQRRVPPASARLIPPRPSATSSARPAATR